MDMMCSRCHKRPAVVFMSGMSGSQKFENGYCLKCAKELDIPQVNEYLKQMGLSDIDLDSIADLPFFNAKPDDSDPDDDFFPDDEDDDSIDDDDMDDDDMTDDEDDDAVDGFKEGGTMPAFFQRFFEAPSKRASASSSENDDSKRDSKL